MDISKYLIGHQLTTNSAKPLYRQLVQQITVKIVDHSLPPGTRLPSEREMAELVGVSRTTVINAYRELEKLGLVISKTGSGTYIAKSFTAGEEVKDAALPWSQLFVPTIQTQLSSILRDIISDPVSEDTISLDAGMPDHRLYPKNTVRELLEKYLRCIPEKFLGYLPTEGYPPLRQAIASSLIKKDIKASADNTMIVSGAQQGLYMLTKTLLEPGDAVMVQSPTYIGALQMFQSAAARVLSLPVASSFPFSQMENYLLRYRPKLLYLVPTYNNPTGYTITAKDRQELIRLAKQYQLVIVEDDPYSDLWFESPPPNPLKSYDNYGGVVYVGTFSKSFLPGVRTGYVVAHPALINRLAMEKQYVDLHSNNFSQLLIMAVMETDFFPSHLAMVRQEYRKRRDTLVTALQSSFKGDLSFSLPDGGFYLWCSLKGINAEKLLQESIRAGISFVPGCAFYPLAEKNNELRLCFASATPIELTEAVNRLNSAYQYCLARTSPPSPGLHQSTRPIV